VSTGTTTGVRAVAVTTRALAQAASTSSLAVLRFLQLPAIAHGCLPGWQPTV
jgi:hypothetical protein